MNIEIDNNAKVRLRGSCRKMEENKVFSTPIENEDEIGKIVEFFAKHIKQEKLKNKIPLVITGSGISKEHVPDMNIIMTQICELLNGYSENTFSSTLNLLKNNYNEYKNSDNAFEFQSKLLSYIQCAYLNDQHDSVEKQDIEPLTKVWNSFMRWLLDGDENYVGLCKAKVPVSHNKIVEMYKNMNAVSITTNFDNLLNRSFKENGSNDISFVPILTDADFHNFYLNNPIEGASKIKQMIEIQSRGDVFWSRCSGKYNIICPHTRSRCYVPETKMEYDNDNHIKCSICGSPIDVYFAFPATKEKDTEMAKVFSMVWKYLALRCSTIIIVGSSMNYDPVLMHFILELSKREEIAILYVSYSKSRKDITDRLFYENTERRKWVYGKGAAETILSKLNSKYNDLQISSNNDQIKYNADDYIVYAKNGIGEGTVDSFITADSENKIYYYDKLIELKRFSQLGLKTYWLSNSKTVITNHNRYKHSVNTMIIASALYLSVKKDFANINELRFIQTAALLHDLGHLPFSHLFEEIFKEFGWIPYGENKTFNHEYNTKEKITELFKTEYADDDKPAICKFFESTKYTVTDLIRLIQGEFGVGCLDAIINSPIDADKIEYLFTDSTYIGQKNINFETFMNDYKNGISCNENQFMILSNKSTSRMLDLLKMRADMYNKFYLRSGLRYLESCCKLIIKTHITHLLCDDCFDVYAKGIIEHGNSQNLSTIKIKYVIKWIEDTINSRPQSDLNNVCELYLINKMMEQLKNNKLLSDDMKSALEFCYTKIVSTNCESKVNDIENDYIISVEIPENKVNPNKIRNLIKTVNLRFPGIIMLDYVESKAAFSFSNSGMPKKRNDKTNQRCENIIINDIDIDYNSSKHDESYCFGDATDLIIKKLGLATNSIINIYKICDESYKYYIAKDYVFNELRELGIAIESSIK